MTGRDRAGGDSVAIIDLGTITTRLLVRGPDTDIRHEPITRMGAELTRSGVIGERGLARVGAALAAHRRTIIESGTARVRVLGTAAARRAGDADDLSRLVSDVLDVELEIIDAATEARLAFAGAVLDAPGDDDDPVAVIDIGGGSTEFAVGTRRQGLVASSSVEVGAMVVGDTYLAHDPPWASELSAALSVIQLHLDDVRRELPSLAPVIEAGTVVGVGGTIATVAAVEIGMLVPNPAMLQGFTLAAGAVEEVFRTLATEGHDDRRHNPGLDADRVDLIVGGCAVLVETMRHLAIGRLRVSVRDLLDGAAAEFAKQPNL